MTAEAPSLAPVLAAIESAAAELIAGCFHGGLARPVIAVHEARDRRARGVFHAGAWQDGATAEISLPRRLLRDADALLDELFHQLGHQACAEAGATARAECGGWHPWAFAVLLAETVGCRPPAVAVPGHGFAAVRPPRGAGPLFLRLSKVMARVLRLHAAALPTRRRAGRNLRVWWCGCDPPWPIRRSGEAPEALCLRCRQRFEEDESAA